MSACSVEHAGRLQLIFKTKSTFTILNQYRGQYRTGSVHKYICNNESFVNLTKFSSAHIEVDLNYINRLLLIIINEQRIHSFL